MRQVIKLSELLPLIGWSASRFYRRERAGSLPFQPLPRRSGDLYEFRLADIEAYLGAPIDLEALDAVAESGSEIVVTYDAV